MSSNPSTVHLVIAPRRQILRDSKSNAFAMFVIAAFLLGYVLVSAAVIRRFEPSWPYGHALYFTIINVTTVGFGDVYPTNHRSSIVSCVNALVGFVLLGILVAAISLAFQPGEFSGSATFTPVAEPALKSETAKPLESAIRELVVAVKTAVEGGPTELRSFPQRTSTSWFMSTKNIFTLTYHSAPANSALHRTWSRNLLHRKYVIISRAAPSR